MTLSRRDRAAMVLALECLRGDDAGVDTLRYGDERGFALWACVMGATYAPEPTDHRILRARLALALRTLLRVDAIDRGEWCDSTRTRIVCNGCGDLTDGYKHGERMTTLWGDDDTPPDVCPRTGRVEFARHAIPLWQQAPAAGTATRPAGLRSRHVA